GGRGKIRSPHIRPLPQAIAPERDTLLRALPIETPQSAPVPFQVLANSAKNIRSGGGEVVGLRQSARDRVRRRHALLAALALGDVFAGNQDNRIITRPPHRLGILACP